MDDEEAKAIWYVLRELLKDGLGVDPARIPAGIDPERMFTPLNENTLEQRMRRDPGRSFQQGEVIQLRPPSKDADVAAVSYLGDVGGGHAAWRFYLGMWLRAGRFIGFRFEPPGYDVNHPYYHSQLCTTMGDRSRISGALPVPERYPAMPLAASSSLELLLYLVVSIHGMAGFNDLRGRIKEDEAMRQHSLLVRALDGTADMPAGVNHQP